MDQQLAVPAYICGEEDEMFAMPGPKLLEPFGNSNALRSIFPVKVERIKAEDVRLALDSQS